MAHSFIRLLRSWRLSPAGGPVTAFRSPRVCALLSQLTAEAQRPYGCEMFAGLSRPEWLDREALTNLLAALLNLRQATGDSTAAPSSFHVNLDAVQFNVASDNWVNYPTRGVAYARS